MADAASVSAIEASTRGESRPTAAVVRLLRLWWLYGRLDLVWIMRGPVQALAYYASDLILAIGMVTATLLLAERFVGIGPWTKPQVVFMLGYTLIVGGLLNIFFGYNVLFISRRLGRGQLDHTLIQPQPIWMAFLTEGFTPFSGSVALLPGLGLVVWASDSLDLTVTPGWLALAVLNVVASAAIFLSFSVIWGSLAFWAPRAAEEISSSAIHMIDQLRPFPLDGLGVFAGGLLTLVPAGFVAWFPCRALLGIDSSGTGMIVTPVAGVLFSALAAWVFRKGMAHYGRTGSQRYLPYGHRS